MINQPFGEDRSSESEQGLLKSRACRAAPCWSPAALAGSVFWSFRRPAPYIHGLMVALIQQKLGSHSSKAVGAERMLDIRPWQHEMRAVAFLRGVKCSAAGRFLSKLVAPLCFISRSFRISFVIHARICTRNGSPQLNAVLVLLSSWVRVCVAPTVPLPLPALPCTP